MLGRGKSRGLGSRISSFLFIDYTKIDYLHTALNIHTRANILIFNDYKGILVWVPISSDPIGSVNPVL